MKHKVLLLFLVLTLFVAQAVSIAHQVHADVPSCHNSGCADLLKSCQPAYMNLTRPADSTDMKWLTYNVTGFDSQGNCSMLMDKYYIPQFGVMQSGNAVCSLPRDSLNISNVTAFISSGGAISGCHPIHYHGLPIPQAGLTHVYNLTIANQTYPIRYGFLDNGTVENMTADTPTTTVTVTIKDYYDNSSDQERLFSVEFPRAIFNANHSATNQIGCSESGNGAVAWQAGGDDIPFAINVTNNPAFVHINGGETCGRYARVVSFDYPSGVSTVQIIGTNMVPEFGNSYSTLVASLAIATAVVSVRLYFRKGSSSDDYDERNNTS